MKNRLTVCGIVDYSDRIEPGQVSLRHIAGQPGLNSLSGLIGQPRFRLLVDGRLMPQELPDQLQLARVTAAESAHGQVHAKTEALPDRQFFVHRPARQMPGLLARADYLVDCVRKSRHRFTLSLTAHQRPFPFSSQCDSRQARSCFRAR